MKKRLYLPWFIAVLFAVWAFAQVAFGFELVHPLIRFYGYAWKNYIGGIIVGVGAIWLVLTVAQQRNLPPMWFRLFLLGMLYPCYAITSLFISGHFSAPLTAMYVLWALYTFGLVPLLYVKGIIVNDPLRLVFFVLFAGLLYAITFYGFGFGNLYWRGYTDRITYGMHPNMYGQGLAVIGAFSVIAILRSAKSIWFYGLVYTACLVLLWYAVMRSYLIFLVVFAGVCIVLLLRNRTVVVASLWAVILAFLIAIMNYDMVVVDNVSSGRISLYREIIQTHWSGQPDTKWFFGVNEYVAGDSVNLSEDKSAEFRIESVNHSDNTYLSVVLGYGFVGLFLFLLPYAYIYWLNWRFVWEFRSTEAIIGVATLVGFGAVALAQASVPSLGNAMAIVTPLLFNSIFGSLTKVRSSGQIERRVIKN